MDDERLMGLLRDRSRLGESLGLSRVEFDGRAQIIGLVDDLACDLRDEREKLEHWRKLAHTLQQESNDARARLAAWEPIVRAAYVTGSHVEDIRDMVMAGEDDNCEQLKDAKYDLDKSLYELNKVCGALPPEHRPGGTL